MIKPNEIFIIILILILIILFIYEITNKENFENNDEPKYTAIIIEPRQHKALEFVLNNFLDNLDDKWNIILFHGNSNIEFVSNILNKMDENKRKRISLNNLDVDNLTIKEYNKLLKNKNFYSNIPTEVFLVFQTDSMICSDFKNKIYDFIDYDYVGAPWENNLVGNGGLSLRRKSKMLEIIDLCKTDNPNLNEDLFFSNTKNKCNRDVTVNKPDFNKAKEFSMEHVYSENGSFGIHQAWLFLDNELLNSKCKNVNLLKKLN